MEPPCVIDACIAPLHELSPASRKTTTSLLASDAPLKVMVRVVDAKMLDGETDTSGGEGGGVGHRGALEGVVDGMAAVGGVD